jgi:hypothetical protein
MSSNSVYREHQSRQFDRFLETLEKLGREDLAKNPDKGLNGIVLIKSQEQQQQLVARSFNRKHSKVADTS